MIFDIYMKASLPSGVWPVMLTPFLEGGGIDEPAVDSLTDWYIDQGAAGLFAVCLSSEMYELSPEERLALAGRVVRRAAGRLPVVAAGTFGGAVKDQAEFARKMSATGVQNVIVIVNQFAAQGENEEILRERLDRFLGLTDPIALGLYECPVPYHRLLSPALLGWAAATGRFFFHKDTSCVPALIRAKLEAVRGTPLRWFNANSPTLLDSLLAGGAGYSGIAVNFIPRLYVRLCAHFRSHPGEALRLQHFLSVADMVARHLYPASAKRFLSRCGVPIGPVCRIMPAPDFQEEELLILEHLMALAEEWDAKLPRDEA